MTNRETPKRPEWSHIENDILLDLLERRMEAGEYPFTRKPEGK